MKTTKIKTTRIKYYLKLRSLFAERTRNKKEADLFRDILTEIKYVERLETNIRNIEMYLKDSDYFKEIK